MMRRFLLREGHMITLDRFFVRTSPKKISTIIQRAAADMYRRRLYPITVDHSGNDEFQRMNVLVPIRDGDEENYSGVGHLVIMAVDERTVIDAEFDGREFPEWRKWWELILAEMRSLNVLEIAQAHPEPEKSTQSVTFYAQIAEMHAKDKDLFKKKTDPQIATLLGCSERTVKDYRLSQVPKIVRRESKPKKRTDKVRKKAMS
jgi:hypothetical protein